MTMKCNLLHLIHEHPAFASQRQLALAAGMDPKQMSRLSRNLLKGLHFETMQSLCLELDCTLDELFSIG